MNRILPFILIILTGIALSDSASQTDWSGGPGVPGPVSGFGTGFNASGGINWASPPGVLLLQMEIVKHIVDSSFQGASAVCSADIDGDGDIDIAGAARIGDEVSWWENLSGTGTSWSKVVIRYGYHEARSIDIGDIDGDGDPDVIGSAYTNNLISWWENSDTTPGQYWTEHTVTSEFSGAHCAVAADIDGDNDLDIAGVAYNLGEIRWWENLNGTGTSWNEHSVTGSSFPGARWLTVDDINGDGYLDIVACSTLEDDVSWWRNDDGTGTAWTRINVDLFYDGVYCVASGDIDGDSDHDVVATAIDAGSVVWWENQTGTGTSWLKHTVSSDFPGGRSVCIHDMDLDGDLDLAGAASDDTDEVSWWENLAGSGMSWSLHVVDDSFENARSVYADDIDGNTLPDLIGASCLDNTVAWWSDLQPGSGFLESSILDTGTDPVWDYIEWTSLEPSGTDVLFQVRASDDPGNMGSWSDTLSGPGPLSGILSSGDSYFQYRAFLLSDDPDITPVLDDIMVSWDPMGTGGDEVPSDPMLLSFWPNPTHIPVIRFSLPEPANVSIAVFDLSGRKLFEIGGDYQTGLFEKSVSYLPPGIYLCRMISGEFSAVRRFVVIE